MSAAHAPAQTPLREATWPTRVALRTGLRALIVLEQAKESRVAADVVILTDHVNGLGDNPLIGPEDAETRFVDMSGAYVASLRHVALSCAATLGLKVVEGVYYSTRTHVDTTCEAVGPGVAPEAILAARFDVPVLALVSPPESADHEKLNRNVARWLIVVAGEWVETGRGAEPPGHTAVS